jgi:tetratricopeptide (TPR) repeat protein
MIVFGSHAGTLVLFYTASRYRIPLAPIVIIFAGVALVGLAGLARGRAWKKLALAGVFLVVAYPLAHQPVRKIGLGNLHYNAGLALGSEANQLEVSAEELDRSGDAEAAAASRAEAERLRARAEWEYRRGLEIRPDHRQLGPALREVLAERLRQAEREERWQDAAERARKLTRAYPASADAFWRLGVSLARAGDPRRARIALQQALMLQPHHAGAREELRRLDRAEDGG